MMKYIFALAVGLSLVLLIHAGAIPKEFEEKAPQIRKACQDESGVSTEILEKSVENPLTEDPKFKCYIKCVLANFEVINKDGLHWDAVVQAAPPSYKEWAGKVKEHCKDVGVKEKSDDLCDVAYEAYKCIYETSPSEFFLI